MMMMMMILVLVLVLLLYYINNEPDLVVWTAPTPSNALDVKQKNVLQKKQQIGLLLLLLSKIQIQVLE
jgi:hypothetical protein